MPQININHAFVSAKPDSADGSAVSSGEWNANLLVSGGATGQILVRDASSPTGAGSIAGGQATGETDSHTGASPGATLAPTVITIATNAFTILFVTVSATTSGSAPVTISLREDGFIVSTFRGLGDGTTVTGVSIFFRTPGTRTYSIDVASDSGTFTTLFVSLPTLTIGVL